MIYDKQRVTDEINQVMQHADTNKVSDGFHTFGELYEFRLAFNAVLFNEWYNQGIYDVHKSRRHFDDNPCFDGTWFIVCATMPEGQISFHYPMVEWFKFNVEEAPKAKHEWDGHTSEIVLKRLFSRCMAQNIN